MHRVLCIVCLTILLTLALPRFSGTLSGQTLVDLRTQSKSVDFSAATTTKPAKSGTALPATCSVGELFYNTAAPAGSNLYGCTATNSWTVQGASLLPAVTGNQGKLLSTDGTSYLWSTLGGDVSGAPGAITVTQILGRPLSASVPSSGQFLVWNGSNWAPLSLAGDINGTPGAVKVAQIQGEPVSAASPATGQSLVWGGSNWAPQSLAGDVTGTPGAVKVTQIQGEPVSTTPPASGQSLVWSGTSWAPLSIATLPGVTSQAGKLLSTDGTNPIWTAPGWRRERRSGFHDRRADSGQAGVRHRPHDRPVAGLERIDLGSVESRWRRERHSRGREGYPDSRRTSFQQLHRRAANHWSGMEQTGRR